MALPYFFKTAFANSGDVAAVPRATQPDGTVSYEKGFPVNYQEDPDTEPTAHDIPRDQFNQLLKALTANMQQWQIQAFPDFITSGDNDGSAYSYEINAHVRYNNGWAGSGEKVYYSLVDANTTDPTDATKWGLVKYQSFELAGVCKEYMGTTLPTGYVWANGTTIGNASSGGTGRASADTVDLFTLLWNSYSNTVLPIQTSAGAPSTRGANAAADFAANKRMPVPDKRGRVTAGADNMGGVTAAGRLTTAGSSIDGSTLGASGGAQNVTLDTTMIPSHSHSGTTASNGTHSHTCEMSPSDSGFADAFGSDGPYAGGFKLSTDSAGAHTHTFTTGNTGSGAAHLNVQPTIVSNFIIALGTA